MPNFAESRRDDGYISNFILTLPRPKIGAFLYAFGAVLLLSGKGQTDNTLYFSGLQCVIMFKKRKRLIYNDRVANGYCGRALEGVFGHRTTQTLPYNYIFFCCYFVANSYLCIQKVKNYGQANGKTTAAGNAVR
jgi:hypothetical protein